MARKEFLDYVWKYCIEPQLGYSFSLNHTLPYSLIAVQEANLATRWDPLYWCCACLCVNAGNYVKEMGDAADDEEENEEVEDAVSDKKEKRVAPNYGKIAKAISDVQLSGVQVELPAINNAQVDFVPDVKNQKIYYSLQAISTVGVDLLEKILVERPFTSLQDFLDRVQPTQTQMLGLIKAGCFNQLCGKTQQGVLAEYLQHEAEKNFPRKDKLTAVNLKKLIELKWAPPEFRDELRVFKFKRYIDANQYDASTKRYLLSEETCQKFFATFIEQKLNCAKGDYSVLPEGVIAIKSTAFKKAYDSYVGKIVDFLNTPKGQDTYLETVRQDYINGITDKYCYGSESRWEFETMSFYHGDHELKNVNNTYYNIVNFNDLPETSEKPTMCALAGTVVGTNNMRHMVSILTPRSGVVDVKLFGDAYVRYNKKISTVDPDTKKKTVVDDSWFKRGNKIIVYGMRKENTFHCRGLKTEYGTRYVGLIKNVNHDGTLDISYKRASVKGA